jgi:hypothetical protein
LAEFGCSTKDRVQQLSSILKGTQRRKTTIYRKAKRYTEDAYGNKVERDSDELEVDLVIETDATFNERVKAIDVLNKMDGTYAKVDAAKQIAVSEYEQLRKRLYKQLRASVGTSDCKDEVPEGTGEVDCGTP